MKQPRDFTADPPLAELVDAAREVERCWREDAPMGFAVILLRNALAPYADEVTS